MPKVNGMDAAEKIREVDENVVLMFITNMAQYAIHGYSVGALDFVTKPLNYYTFAMKLTRALKRVPQKEATHIMLPLPDGVKRLEVRKIFYLEVQNRLLHYTKWLFIHMGKDYGNAIFLCSFHKLTQRFHSTCIYRRNTSHTNHNHLCIILCI